MLELSIYTIRLVIELHETLTIKGTEVIVNVRSFCPGRWSLCSASCHQLMVSDPSRTAPGASTHSSSVTLVTPNFRINGPTPIGTTHSQLSPSSCTASGSRWSK